MSMVASAAHDPVVPAVNDPSLSVCMVCRCRSPKLKRCQRCRSVYYCSVECQSVDWTQGGHRSRCAPKRTKGQKNGMKERNSISTCENVAIPPALVQQSYQELLQLMHTKPLLELQQDYHKVSDHIRLQNEEEEGSEKAPHDDGYSTDPTASVPPSLLPLTSPPPMAWPPMSHPVSPLASTTPSKQDENETWKWSMEHLSHLQCLQWILRPPQSSNDSPVLHPDRARIASIQRSDLPHVLQLVFEYNNDDDTHATKNGNRMNGATRIAVELPIGWAPAAEDATTIQCLDQNRSLCIRWSYARIGIERSSPLLKWDGPVVDENPFGKFPSHPWVACRHCHTPIARVQPRPGDPIVSNPPANTTAADGEASALSSPPPIDTILSLPSGYFQELQDYLVCFNEGPTSIDFQNDTAILPPVGTLYENETLYVIHSENVVPDALCRLSIPMYGTNDANQAVESAVARAHAQWLRQQPWLQSSPQWSCHTIPERRDRTEQELGREGEFSFFREENEPANKTHCATCSFCASVIGFATDIISPALFGGDATMATAKEVTVYQLLKHQLISLAAVASTSTIPESGNLTPDGAVGSPSSSNSVLLSHRSPLVPFQNLLSISQFVTYEMIRIAETKAIFALAVICVEEEIGDQWSDKSRMSPDLMEGACIVTTSVLHLRLFHWNTVVASSEECTTKSIPCLDSDRTTAKGPIHDTSPNTVATTPVPIASCVPHWRRRVKVLFEVNEYSTEIGLVDQIAASDDSMLVDNLTVNDESAQAMKNSLALANMMTKRWDMCCPSPFRGLSHSTEPSKNTTKTSNVVRIYLSRPEWNQLYKELIDHNETTVALNVLQSQLRSTLTSSLSTTGPTGSTLMGIPDPKIRRGGTTMKESFQFSGISVISIL